MPLTRHHGGHSTLPDSRYVQRITEDEATKVLDDVAEFIYGRGDLDATVVMRREEPGQVSDQRHDEGEA